MPDPTYPSTLLRIGQLDPEYGGQTKNTMGGPMRAFMDAQAREAHRQIILLLWKPYAHRKMKIASGGTVGDLVFDHLAGAETDYTLLTIAGLTAASATYDPDDTPRVGMLAESVSAGEKGLVIEGGPGIPPAIHGLGAGAAGWVRMNTTTGRIIRDDASSKPIVGTINARGYVRLIACVPGVLE